MESNLINITVEETVEIITITVEEDIVTVHVDAVEETVQVVVSDTVQGDSGKSAYEVWLDAGNTGSETLFLLSLKGLTGQGFRWRGTWKNRDYLPYDVVIYNGSCYVCTQEIGGEWGPDAAPNSWDLMVSKGDTWVVDGQTTIKPIDNKTVDVSNLTGELEGGLFQP